jgi:hypothetical protein
MTKFRSTRYLPLMSGNALPKHQPAQSVSFLKHPDGHGYKQPRPCAEPTWNKRLVKANALAVHPVEHAVCPHVWPCAVQDGPVLTLAGGAWGDGAQLAGLLLYALTAHVTRQHRYG